ncbi:SulP family inorganic anion transporter [Bacillus marinisedimentorum]|uniref:SulP family inorganic anion transporter n=1 Tax=Bacillus marinisedimentorum TaxID=1821260 RepID=UPI00087243D9|nr:solute carrier family 26 protein [Bacillus marinisedimentorum]
MNNFLPAAKWIRDYDRANLGSDFTAGLIVAIMLIPQGMAYAMLAGLPPVIGLYASTIPLIIYALFGSSRQLAVGPVAMVSLLVFTGVSVLAEPGSDEYVSLVFLLALMVGVIQLLLGVLRLGFIVNFLSHAVISGFTSAAAIIIGLSQLKHLLGVKLESGKNVAKLLFEVIQKITLINPTTFAIGVGSIIILIAIKKMVPKVPGPLVVVVLSTLIVFGLNLNENAGVSIVGTVPGGLPALSLPMFSIDAVLALLPIALTISFVGFMESIAMAKAIATKEKYKISSNQELSGLGLANIGASIFSGYPVTGGFSRSAVNYQAGAKTPLASIITAVLIMLTLLFFTPLFYFLPNAVLAAIIMVAVYGLIDFKEARILFHIRKIDGLTWVITFLGTLLLGIEQGILIGAGFSLAVFIWRSAYPHVAELGYVKSENVYRNIERVPEADTDPQVLIFRIDASLYFANMSFLEDKLCAKMQERQELKWIVLDFSAVNSIDAVALHALEELMENCTKGDIELMVAGVKGPVRDLIHKSGLSQKFQDVFHYPSIEHAMEEIEKSKTA